MPFLADLKVTNTGYTKNTVSHIGSNKNIEQVGRLNNLDAIVNRNPPQPGVSTITITVTPEALLGAVYLDSHGTTMCVRLVVEKLGLWPDRDSS